MNELARYDDHLLIITQDGSYTEKVDKTGFREWVDLGNSDGRPRLARIACPFEARGPEGTWGRCGYLEQCPCERDGGDYHKDTLRFIELVQALEKAKLVPPDFEDDLDRLEWIDGTYVALDAPTADGYASRHMDDVIHSSVRLGIESHEDCRHTGLQHVVWEGELHTATGRCSLRGHFSEYGRDALDDDLPYYSAGQWPVDSNGDGEDWLITTLPDPRGPRARRCASRYAPKGWRGWTQCTKIADSEHGDRHRDKHGRTWA